MSDQVNNNTGRFYKLCDFARRLTDGEDGRRLIFDYKEYIDTVTAAEAMQVLDYLLVNGYSFETVKKNVGKIINVFYKSLSSATSAIPSGNYFLQYLALENRAVEKIMIGLRTLTKQIFKVESSGEAEYYAKLRYQISLLKDYELHYIKKENILFPFLEKAFPQYRCLKLMWSFHDDFRRSVKVLDGLLANPEPDKKLINSELGKLFFVVLPVIFREEQIVFPVALSALPEKSWDLMLEQSHEIGWSYKISPEHKQSIVDTEDILSGQINLGTGFLTPEQLILMLNSLPVDITFVDENDEVRYFSGGKARIFPRSKGIIGRKVQNCHPPESVHIVNEILDAFRNGTKEHADFWIQLKGAFLHIRYFALHDERGSYKGTIEVSQDITDIRQLTGEQRLISWGA